MFARYKLRYVIAQLLCCALLNLPADGVESNQPRLSSEGLLVLTNGQVIQGVIAQDGQYFKVELPRGKLQVRIDQVDFLCQSKEEAYIRRRARKITSTATADAHLEMARWCVQNELLACADAEIAAAKSIDPRHRLLASVERQLVQAREVAQRTSQSTHITIDERVVATSVVFEDAGQAFGKIPTWARTEFIKRIQPMMCQSCATSGCHLPNMSQKFQLDRLALDGVGNPDLIHHNLASTIAMLDLTEPEESALLEQAASVHGEDKNQSRPLNPHQLEILRAWVTQLAINEPPHEAVEQTPVTQIVVGMNSGPKKQFVSGASGSATSPDPFDPAEFNESRNAASAPQPVPITRPTEVLPAEQAQ